MDKTSIKTDIRNSIREAMRVNGLPLTDIDVIGKLYRQEFQSVSDEIEAAMSLYIPVDTEVQVRIQIVDLWHKMTNQLMLDNDKDIFAVCEILRSVKFTDKNESQRMLQLTIMNLAGHLDDKPWWVKLFDKKERWIDQALKAFDVSEKPSRVVTDSGLLTTSNV